MDGRPTPQFSSFTLQKPPTPGSVFISDIGSDGQHSRLRRVHTKSRNGCTSCKARKIKCDEGQPCHNCTKRNQKCSFTVPSKGTSSTVSHQLIAKVEQPPTLNLNIHPPLSSPINLEHMRLLHHFQTCTSLTFIMDPEIWKETVVNLASENTFLMHAVFLVTATHLQHLQPHETGHQLAALEHLSHALPTFRKTLAANSDFTGSHGEALILCSMLLLQYSWTYDSGDWAGLLGLYRGLKNIVLEFIDTLNGSEGSHLTSMLSYSPRMRIERHLQSMPISADIEAIFTHVLFCPKISETEPENLEDFSQLSDRLMTILSALKLGHRNLEASGLMLDVARYLFSFPNLFPSGFVSMIRREDRRAQVIMLYYFATVSRLRADRFWWMRERGVCMYRAIVRSLGDACTDCTDLAKVIFEGDDSEALGSNT